jgi:peroxin-3
LLTVFRTCKWLPYLLPSQEEEAYVLQESGMTDSSAAASPSLRRLIDETSDLIDSPSFTHVLTHILDAAFSHLVDTKIAQLSYKIPPTSASTARIQEIVNPADAKAKVANSLAVFCRQAHAIGTGANNEYLTAIEGVRDLEAFAAVVYSSNFEFETPEAGSLSRPTTATGLDSAAESLRTNVTGGLESGTASVRQSWTGPDSGLESAWGKALAKEDGKAH